MFGGMSGTFPRNILGVILFINVCFHLMDLIIFGNRFKNFFKDFQRVFFILKIQQEFPKKTGSHNLSLGHSSEIYPKFLTSNFPLYFFFDVFQDFFS